MKKTINYALSITALAALVACGGGGGGDAENKAPVGALEKYAGSYAYCDQDHTKYSIVLTSAGNDTLEAVPTEVTYQNSNCSGSILGTYSWTAPEKITLSSTSVGTVSGGGLPASLLIEKVQRTLSNINITLTGPNVSGNCITYPGGSFCYEKGPFNETKQGGLYLSDGKLHELLLENGVYNVNGIYNKNYQEPAAVSQTTEAAFSEAKSYVSSQMKDPTSVVYQNLKVYRLGSDTTVCGQFNAKNSFGAYVGFKNFYYRPSEASLFKFVYQTSETGSMAYIINNATNKLINSVCSDISDAAADAAQAQYFKEILP